MKYRRLKVGDTIQPGDEMQVSAIRWVAVYNIVDSIVFASDLPFRRPIQPKRKTKEGKK